MSVAVAVLGSTGSVGRSTLRVIRRQKDRFRVVALTAYDSAVELEEQARETDAEFIGLVDGSRAAELEPSQSGRSRRVTGQGCLVEAATLPRVRIVVNAVVGAAGLEATLAALRAGKRVALANKESLVTAGDLVLAVAKEGGGEIVPIDSEHSAVLQCIAGDRKSELSRLILTASGGPFREWAPEKLTEATISEALNHPTWNMGRKITVDSATLANKALEVIEAHYLFGLDYDRIEVVVHPQSIVHAFAEFVDGSILAQVGYPSMELPILYALTYPDRVADDGVKRFNPVEAGSLSFEPLRTDTFRAFDLGIKSGRKGGTAPAVFNAVNEVAVQAFLDGKIAFGRIPEIIESVLESHTVLPASDLDTIQSADGWARATASGLCS